MFATALWQADRQENIEQLKMQLDGCISVPEEVRAVVEPFLMGEDIFSLADLDAQIRLRFALYLEKNHIHNKAKVRTYLYALEKYQNEYRRLQYRELLAQIETCTISKCVKNKATAFLINNGVKSLSEIDCELRDQYVSFLENSIAKSKVAEYVKGLDNLKLHDTQTWKEKHPFKTPQILYEEKKIYLLYLPDYEIAKSFYYIQDKKCLFWDFSQNAPDKLKRQVFYVLVYALKNIKDTKDCKVRYLLPLHWLYDYCVEQGIEDIEQLEFSQIEGFQAIVAEKVAGVGNSMQIIDNCRKRLFIDSNQTNWFANVWYIERFNLRRERMNPSNPIIRLSFLEVFTVENRRLLQDYMKYQIGVSNWSISHVRQNYYYALDFLRFLDHTGTLVIEATMQDIDSYLTDQEERELLPATYNRKVTNIYQFFRFLKVKKHIERIPFYIEYYLKEVIPIHHDRSVEHETVKDILQNLYHFPIHLRLMYLNLWCIGLRVNEVCTLKGNAYYKKDDIAWIRVYQNKMRAEKTVPIPTMLYKLMVAFIQINNIKPDEYIFHSAKGQAYHVGAFAKQMKEQLNLCGITCADYHFRAHDYRHTVATFLYAHGASLQAVRDYLGHEKEEMTMQYVDYIPNMIKEANEEYFSNEENNLAACLKRKEDS